MDKDRIEEILKKIGSQDIPNDIKQIAENQSKEFIESLKRQKPHISWSEIIMRNSIVKLAAAAVIIVAVIAGISLFEKTSSVVWADVVEKVLKVKSMAWKMDMTTKGMPNMPPDQEMKMSAEAVYLTDYGMKMKMFMNGKLAQEQRVLFSSKTMYILILEAKKYLVMHLSDDQIEQLKKQSGNPSMMFSGLKNFKQKDLGERIINGVSVKGFEASDPNSIMGNLTFRVWVDVATSWPYQMEMELLNGQVYSKVITSDFQWNIDVSKSDFEPNIPTDYSMMAEASLPDKKNIAEAMAKSFKTFSDLTGGKYPGSLNMGVWMKEFAEAAKRLKTTHVEHDQMPNKEDMQKLMDMQMGFTQFAQLQQEQKDPVYYGHVVKPGDANGVLVRWKNDDGTYKVIFGDLHIEDVNKAELDELEADMPKDKPDIDSLLADSNDFRGHQTDYWYPNSNGKIVIDSNIVVAECPKDANTMTLTLAYENGHVESITTDGQPLEFTCLGKGNLQINLPQGWKGFANKTYTVRWSIGLETLGKEDGYKTVLKTMIPTYSYKLNIVLTEGCGFENSEDSSQIQFSPFNGNNSNKAIIYQGSCGLLLKQK